MRTGNVYFDNRLAGFLSETEDGFLFTYDDVYFNDTTTYPISLTLPKTTNQYQSKTLFPFFDGLVPEGWLLDIAEKNWKHLKNDRFGLLLAFAKDCIGAVSIEEVADDEQ